MRGNLISSLMLAGSMIMGMHGATLAINNVDIAPPSGRIAVLRAAEVVDDISKIESQIITFQIYAKDNISSENGIKYYFGTTPLADPVNADSSVWKSYYEGVREDISINMNENNTIYLVLKDENGNTSTVYKDASTEYQIIYDANGGIDAPVPAKAYYGTPFNVSTKRPSYEGKYFLGWSTSKNATNASYYQGSTISADMFTDTKKEITLYAVWSDEISKLPLLSNRVKIGDYIDYPVYYENVDTTLSEECIPNLKGWRVLSIENDGTVNLISAGVPLSYHHHNNPEITIRNLTMDFLNIPFSIEDNYTFRKNGFSSYSSLKDIFNNKYTATYEKNTVVSYTSTGNDGTVVTYSGEKKAGELKVRSITKEDLDKIYDPTGATITKNGTFVKEKKYGDLLAQPAQDIVNKYARYWLASRSTINHLYAVNVDGNVADGMAYNKLGVRPVVSLKPNIRTIGYNISGIWNMELDEFMDLIPSKANEPVLGDGMKAVYWENSNNGTGEITASSYTSAMYDYTMGDGRTDSKDSKWANAITEDGSYWVWIPRYAYKITYTNENKTVKSAQTTSTATIDGTKTKYGNIDILFMDGTSNTHYRDLYGNPQPLPEGYKVHPAFQAMETTEDLETNPLGKWKEELEGIWVAKYEASREDLVNSEWVAYEEQSTYGGGNKATSETIRMVSKPSRLSWRGIQAKNTYENSLNMYENLNSHEMKNSEWGAVAYLTHSAYGRNGNEVGINQNYLGFESDDLCSAYTGAGPGGTADVEGTMYEYEKISFARNYAWNTTQGKKASTTGNIYGVYDFNGGAWEYVASYVNTGNSIISTYGGTLSDATNMHTKQVYKASATDGTSDTAAANYALNSTVYGDAVYETSTTVNSSSGNWNGDRSFFPYVGSPFFKRGGTGQFASGAGVFSFNGNYGGQYNGINGFRPVLCVKK